MQPDSAYIHEPAPDNPGWYTWNVRNPAWFNAAVMGELIVRAEGERSARLRMPATQTRHSNTLGMVHGGVTAALIDIGMFATIYTVLDSDPVGSVTLDLSCQFIGAGEIGQHIDVVCEVLRETRRLIFLRGTVEQPQGLIAGFQGTLRKPSRR